MKLAWIAFGLVVSWPSFISGDVPIVTQAIQLEKSVVQTIELWRDIYHPELSSLIDDSEESKKSETAKESKEEKKEEAKEEKEEDKEPETILPVYTRDQFSTQQIIWNFFKDKGLSDEQTAGIMGNIAMECGYIPNITAGSGKYEYFGLQMMMYNYEEWRLKYGQDPHMYDRRYWLEKKIEETGDILIGQLEYLWEENFTTNMPNSHRNYDALQTNFFGSDPRGGCIDFNEPGHTIEEYSTAWLMNVGRGYTPAGGWQAVEKRAAFARQAYELFTGKSEPIIVPDPIKPSEEPTTQNPTEPEPSLPETEPTPSPLDPSDYEPVPDVEIEVPKPGDVEPEVKG